MAIHFHTLGDRLLQYSWHFGALPFKLAQERRSRIPLGKTVIWDTLDQCTILYWRALHPFTPTYEPWLPLYNS